MTENGYRAAQQSRAPRASVDYIALHARRRPDHVAVISDDRQITYAVLYREVLAMTAALARLDLPAGAMVALEHPRLHPCLLVTLALERLGVTVAPFRNEEGDAAADFIAAADLIMSGSGLAPRPSGNVLHMTEAWLAAALAHPPLACGPRRPSRHDPLILQRTSGSTLRSKQLLLTCGALAARVAQRVVCHGFHRHDRFLAIMQFTVGPIYTATQVCLRLGATVMHHSRMGPAALLDRYRPTKLYSLPQQLAGLLEQRGDAPGVPGLTVVVMGSKLPPALRQRACERLCDRLIDSYAANEAGLICTIGADGLGRPAPGTDIEVVDHDGMKLPPGSVGEIRVRGPAVFGGYRDNASATAASVRDGWWHTGDFAVAEPSGIRLLGRRDDLLNFGGIKRVTADIEAAISARCTNDVAVLPARTVEGESVAAICVAGTIADPARLAAVMKHAVPGRYAVYNVEAIPRTPEGKLLRAVLSEDIASRAPLRLVQAG